MQGIREYIVELKDPYNESFKTEGGIEIYADKRFSANRLTNRVAKVVKLPATIKDSPIKEGYEVMIDATILYKQIRLGQLQGYTNLIDEEKMWFRLVPNMIILYRQDSEKEWVGYLNNNLVEEIDKDAIQSDIILTTAKYKGYAKVIYPNQNIIDLGVEKGDEVFLDHTATVPFWIDGKQYSWVRNSEVLGKVLN